MKSSVISVFLLVLLAQLTLCRKTEAQAPDSPRKATPESSIELPEYFGTYAVLKSGKTVRLDKLTQQIDQAPSYKLPSDVEFLVYGKDVNPSSYQLIVGDSVLELLAKPVAKDTQMIRLIPAKPLNDGIFNFGQMFQMYRFGVGDEEPPLDIKNAANRGDVQAETLLGHFYWGQRDYALALKWWQKAAAQGDHRPLNHLAWLYATCPDTNYLDGVRAVEYALKGDAKSPSPHDYYETLAAAYARNNRFDEAVAVQERVFAVVRSNCLTGIEGLYEAQGTNNPGYEQAARCLDLYRHKKAFTDRLSE